MDIMTLNQAKAYARKIAGGSFQDMVFKSRDNTTGIVIYTITFLKNGSPYNVDIQFKDGVNGTNGIDGVNGINGLQGTPGTNGIDGIDAPKCTGIGFVNNDMVFNFSDSSVLSILDAKTTLKGDKGGTLVEPVESVALTNGQDTYVVVHHVVGSPALIVFAEALISRSDYTDLDATHIKLNADVAATITTGTKITSMSLTGLDAPIVGEVYTTAEQVKLASLVGEPKSNLNAVSAPTITDDLSKGYSLGSTWIYNSVTYTCTTDTTGSAVWTSSADIFYFDTWSDLVTTISATGTTYVNKFATVSNANGGNGSNTTYTAPSAMGNPIVDGGQATYKVNTQGTNYSVTCQARTVSNPVITSVMTVATTKPVVAGYYIFTVAPTNGLPVGINLNDISYYNGSVWSLFQNYAASNAIVVVGLISATQVAYRKQAGSWIDVTNNSDISIGDIKITAKSTAPTGWLKCDYSEYSRTTYSNLFNAIGTTYGIGNGSTTFNVPDMRDRTPIGAGQATFISNFAYTSVDIATDIITVPSNDSLITGTPVVFTTTGTVPGGLVSGTTYYIIRISATTIKLATSAVNAAIGAVINITTQGTGTHTLTVTYTNRILGSVGGEESHILSSAEMAHTHGLSKTNVGDFNNNFNVVTNVSGINGVSNVAMNNMQPYVVVNYVIKY